MIFIFSVFAAVFLIAAGCNSNGSNGMERSDKATTTMQTMDDDIKLVIVQLEATGASLAERDLRVPQEGCCFQQDDEVHLTTVTIAQSKQYVPALLIAL